MLFLVANFPTVLYVSSQQQESTTLQSIDSVKGPRVQGVQFTAIVTDAKENTLDDCPYG